MISPRPLVPSEVGGHAKRARVGDGVSTLACPERLPWQAVEGLDTNGVVSEVLA